MGSTNHSLRAPHRALLWSHAPVRQLKRAASAEPFLLPSLQVGPAGCTCIERSTAVHEAPCFDDADGLRAHQTFFPLFPSLQSSTHGGSRSYAKVEPAAAMTGLLVANEASAKPGKSKLQPTGASASGYNMSGEPITWFVHGSTVGGSLTTHTKRPLNRSRQGFAR